MFDQPRPPHRHAATVRNTKSKLLMEAMWSLVKEGSLSKQQIASLDFGSKATVGVMRSKKREIESANNPQRLKMSWAEALQWTPDGEQQVQKLVDQLVAAGIAETYNKFPSVVHEAICRLDPGLPAAVMAHHVRRSKRPWA